MGVKLQPLGLWPIWIISFDSSVVWARYTGSLQSLARWRNKHHIQTTYILRRRLGTMHNKHSVLFQHNWYQATNQWSQNLLLVTTQLLIFRNMLGFNIFHQLSYFNLRLACLIVPTLSLNTYSPSTRTPFGDQILSQKSSDNHQISEPQRDLEKSIDS